MTILWRATILTVLCILSPALTDAAAASTAAGAPGKGSASSESFPAPGAFTPAESSRSFEQGFARNARGAFSQAGPDDIQSRGRTSRKNPAHREQASERDADLTVSPETHAAVFFKPRKKRQQEADSPAETPTPSPAPTASPAPSATPTPGRNAGPTSASVAPPPASAAGLDSSGNSRADGPLLTLPVVMILFVATLVALIYMILGLINHLRRTGASES